MKKFSSHSDDSSGLGQLRFGFDQARQALARQRAGVGQPAALPRAGRVDLQPQQGAFEQPQGADLRLQPLDILRQHRS